MQSLLRAKFLLIYVLFLWNVPAPAQTPAHKAGPGKRYCQTGGGFCFRYPVSWSVLGEVFQGNGVVVAPAQKQPRILWDTITAALVVPSPQGDRDPVSMDQVIEQTMASLREGGQNVETLQRQERSVDGKPAQMIKLRYREKADNSDWIEEVTFIDGPDSEIYSVALKCSPQSLARMEPVLGSILQSWKLPQPEPAPASDDQDVPKTTAPAEKAAPGQMQPQVQTQTSPKN